MIYAAEADLAALIAQYFRREIGVLMHQAEHWAANDKPLAVHHRVRKADAYYQVVSLFEHTGAFSMIQERNARQDVYPPGQYPPGADIHRYREPAFVAALLKGEQPSDQIFVPGCWRCPKCSFVLSQFELNAGDGSVTVRDEPGDKCPNCNMPLWRVSWREDAQEMAKRCEEQIARAIKAENEATTLRARVAELEAAAAHVMAKGCVIRAGDIVHHESSGEDWTVAYVDGDRLAWCGWPEGEAKLSDCRLKMSCSDAEHLELLHRLANSDGKRARRARLALEQLEDIKPCS